MAVIITVVVLALGLIAFALAYLFYVKPGARNSKS